MPLLDNILKWTETSLTIWQRDAARRLFQKNGELSDADYSELYALLKTSHDLPNQLEQAPIPLSAVHLPSIPNTNETIVLKGMRELKHVNRIASGQKLEFAVPVGLTIIYGRNGSGKSGYARVLKRACRARDQAETVHPDANDTNFKKLIPECVFDIEINGAPKTVLWTADADPPEELSAISVFDSHCARSYLTKEGQVAYLPYGLDVIENLANKVLPKLSQMLDDEIKTIDIDQRPYKHLIGETKVGSLISTLSYNSNVDRIKEMGTLTDADLKRITELESALSEPDPKAKEKELYLSATRIKNLVSKVNSALDWVSEESVNRFEELDNTAIVANQAEKMAAEVLRSGEKLLPGTGESVWRALFDAAKKFSIEVAYPDIEFPNTAEGAVCPLCQEPIIDARKRLIRFEKYIKEDVAKQAALKRKQTEIELNRIKQADLSFGLDSSIAEEIDMLENALIPSLATFQTSLENRRNWILNAFHKHTWKDKPSLSDDPRHKLRNLAARQIKLSRIFKRASGEENKALLKSEYSDLRSRQDLSCCIDAILSLIDRMKKKQKLEICKIDLKTRSFTEKSKELAQETVTPILKDAIEKEFNALGIGHINIKMIDRYEKGKVWCSLLLDFPYAHKMEEILSEGEQRAIALGSFLAELQLANHSGGIVFDDPVSSLDHNNRGKLAKRIAQESLKRQVLVFTHEVIFLNQLRDECEKLSCEPVISFLEYVQGYPGNVSEGLPWKQKKYTEQLDKLKKEQKRLEGIPWPQHPSEALAADMEKQYSLLRAAIEKVVEELVLNKSILRFHNYINVKMLSAIVGLNAQDVDEIQRLHHRCSEVTEAHDHASVNDEPPPTPKELLKDLNDLQKLIDTIKDRRKRMPGAAITP